MEKSKTPQFPIPLSKAIGIFLLGSAYSQGLLIVFQHRCCRNCVHPGRDDSKPIPNMFVQDRVRRNIEMTDV